MIRARSGPAVVLVVLSTVTVSYTLVLSMVNPALEPLRVSFHASQAGISWVLTAYLLSSAVLTPFLGRVGDQLGKHRLIVAAAALLAAGSVVAATAPDLGVLLAGRAMQGAGGAILPLAFGILRELLPEERVGPAVGMLAALSSVGAGLGILVAGPIVSGLGIRWLFWVPAIANGIVALLLWLTVPASRSRASGGLNWLAAAAMCAALVCLLLTLSTGATWGWGSVNTTALLGVAVLAGAETPWTTSIA